MVWILSLMRSFGKEKDRTFHSLYILQHCHCISLPFRVLDKMSKRVVTQQLGSCLLQRQGQQSTLRCFATSSSSQAPRLKERKKDANLRHAINLYHLTDFFFPTNNVSEQQGKHGNRSGAGGSAGSEEGMSSFDKELDSHIRFSLMGASTSTSVRSNMDGYVELKGAYPVLAKKTKDDEMAFGSVFGSTMGPVSEASAVNALREENSRPPRLEPQSPLPSIDDKEAVQRYIAETARRSAAVGGFADTRPGDDMDVRGAQVRDALFGTVNGVRPGLEAVRERMREKKERAKKEEVATAVRQ